MILTIQNERQLVHKITLTAITAVCTLSLFVGISDNADAELWDLVINSEIEKGAIHQGESVKVKGKVVDHAYEPIRGAEVLIKTGTDTIRTFTDPHGNFKGEFKDFQKTPGTYKINIIATWYEMMGITSMEFQVKGEVTSISGLQEKLSTEQARKYLGSQETDFEKNPIGQTLFKYYHKLLAELVEEKSKLRESIRDQIYLEEQRTMADSIRKEKLIESEVGAGMYEGYFYDNYIQSLNPQIRETIANQMNFTKNMFVEAQSIQDEIIANGGTFEEARKAYLEQISISKKELEKFNEENLEKTSEKSQNEEDSNKRENSQNDDEDYQNDE